MCKIYSGKNIYVELLELLDSKVLCVLSTTIKTNGSTPQKPGSAAIFGQNGLLAGTIGGGTVEFNIQEIAKKAILKKESLYYTFTPDSNTELNSEAGCGGSMEVLLDANPEKHLGVFKKIVSSGRERIPGVLLTSFSEASSTIEREWLTCHNLESANVNLTAELIQIISQMLDPPIENDCREITITENEGSKIVFLETIIPQPQLIIAGAGHVGKALSHMAGLLNFDVTVWDLRKEFANKDNLPDANTVLWGELDESLANIQVDDNTYLVIVTNNHKSDVKVLKTFIKSPAAYIGMIGSRKKINQIQKIFLAEKWVTKEEWDKVSAPIGIKIHSKTVQEIAISIAAQLVLVRNQNKRNAAREVGDIENRVSANYNV